MGRRPPRADFSDIAKGYGCTFSFSAKDFRSFLFCEKGCTFSFSAKEKVRKRTLLCYIKAELHVVGYTANYARKLAELCRKPPISTIHKGEAASVASLITSMAFCSFPRIDDSAICRGDPAWSPVGFPLGGSCHACVTDEGIRWRPGGALSPSRLACGYSPLNGERNNSSLLTPHSSLKKSSP